MHFPVWILAFGYQHFTGNHGSNQYKNQQRKDALFELSCVVRDFLSSYGVVCVLADLALVKIRLSLQWQVSWT